MSNVGITPYAIAMLKSRDEPAPMDVREPSIPTS